MIMEGSPERRRGEAGAAGEGVRSDLHVVVEGAESGGIALQLSSKVEVYYGDHIRAQVPEVLASLGVHHARVTVRDEGALPFVIAARVEAAARRADLVPDRPLEAAEPDLPAPPAGRLRRSRLYLPGNEPRYMLNAGLHGADAIILDLEDSVASTEKDAARALVRQALLEVDFGSAERMARINPLPLGLADLDAVVPAAPDLILLPKVESPGELAEVDAHIAAIHKLLGWQRPLWLMPILESARGIEAAGAIAGASPRVVALTLGLEDLTADLGVPKTPQGDETLWARSRVVIAARAAGVQAIDSVWGDVGDAEGLAAWGRRSRALGFEGMGCVHPRQVPIVHDAFAPSQAEVDRALRIVQAFAEAEAAGRSVVSLGTKMVDPPVVQRALKLVEQARAAGRLPGETG